MTITLVFLASEFMPEGKVVIVIDVLLLTLISMFTAVDAWFEYTVYEGSLYNRSKWSIAVSLSLIITLYSLVHCVECCS